MFNVGDHIIMSNGRYEHTGVIIERTDGRIVPTYRITWNQHGQTSGGWAESSLRLGRPPKPNRFYINSNIKIIKTGRKGTIDNLIGKDTVMVRIKVTVNCT